MTVEDAVAWCAAHDVSVMFRTNGTQPRSVLIVAHGSPVKAEKPTFVEAVEDIARRLAGHIELSRAQSERVRERKTLGATK